MLCGEQQRGCTKLEAFEMGINSHGTVAPSFRSWKQGSEACIWSPEAAVTVFPIPTALSFHSMVEDGNGESLADVSSLRHTSTAEEMYSQGLGKGRGINEVVVRRKSRQKLEAMKCSNMQYYSIILLRLSTCAPIPSERTPYTTCLILLDERIC